MNEAKKDNKPQHKDAKEAIKNIVALTLHELSLVEGEIQIKQKRRSCLKRDLNDLKEGRLDRIKERHDIDEHSKAISVFTLELKVVIGDKRSENLWYMPYILSLDGKEEAEINNSLTKTHASGTYPLSNGETKYV